MDEADDLEVFRQMDRDKFMERDLRDIATKHDK